MKIKRDIPLSERMFEILDQQLFIFEKALIESGLSANYYRKEKSAGSARLIFLDHPKDRRFNLVAFESLSSTHKEKIKARFGDPYEYVVKEPIRQLVKADPAAESFFFDYRYADNKSLPIEKRHAYTKAAQWLQMLNTLNADKKYIQNELKISLDQFFTAAMEIIKIDSIDLPTSYRRLKPLMKQFKEEGYKCLIHSNYGNKCSAKLGKTEEGFDEALYQKQLSYIRKAASMPNNYDAMQITLGVNAIFKMKGWPTISEATVYKIINENRHLTVAGSRGKREYDNKISMHVKRKRPTMPLQYCTMDGWTAELAYREGNTYHNRLVVVIVLDAMNDYPVGFAIGERENVELIREANRNAIAHIAEIFGGAYRPWQTQSDNYGIKANTNFFEAMSHLHIPAAVGNAKAKVIERYFNIINKSYCQYLPNWTGHNLNSLKKHQPNIEYKNIIKKSFPDRAGVEQQICSIIAKERSSKIEGYLAAWANTPDNDKCRISGEQALLVLGNKHTHQNSITGEGLALTIRGQKYVYDSFEPSFRALQHLPFQVYYNPEDLSEVLAVQEDQRKSFLLQSKHYMPMDVRAMQQEDHAALKMIRDYNKSRVQNVMATYELDNVNVEEGLSDLAIENHTKLKLMFTNNGSQKESLQDAKGLKNSRTRQRKEELLDDSEWQTLQAQYLNSNTDFDKYLDQ